MKKIAIAFTFLIIIQISCRKNAYFFDYNNYIGGGFHGYIDHATLNGNIWPRKEWLSACLGYFTPYQSNQCKIKGYNSIKIQSYKSYNGEPYLRESISFSLVDVNPGTYSLDGNDLISGIIDCNSTGNNTSSFYYAYGDAIERIFHPIKNNQSKLSTVTINSLGNGTVDGSYDLFVVGETIHDTANIKDYVNFENQFYPDTLHFKGEFHTGLYNR